MKHFVCGLAIAAAIGIVSPLSALAEWQPTVCSVMLWSPNVVVEFGSTPSSQPVTLSQCRTLVNSGWSDASSVNWEYSWMPIACTVNVDPTISARVFATTADAWAGQQLCSQLAGA
jgi:hypothetical protein